MKAIVAMKQFTRERPHLGKHCSKLTSFQESAAHNPVSDERPTLQELTCNVNATDPYCFSIVQMGHPNHALPPRHWLQSSFFTFEGRAITTTM